MRRRCRQLGLIVALLVAVAGRSEAQSFHASVVGVVTDSSGAVLPGAAIAIRDVNTGQVRDTVSDRTGAFSLPQLPPGIYEISAQLDGFRGSIQTGLRLETNQVRRVDFMLQIGAVAESLTVIASAPVVNTERSSKGEVITERQIEDLPLNGRDYSELALLVPGVYRRPADDDQAQGLATAGTRTDASNFILDGQINRADRTAGTGVAASVDSIREFNVQTSSYSAEFGRTAGAQINVVSKSGSNRLSGTAFEYLRDDMFDANNYFTAPGAEKSLARHQAGGTLGGPLRPDRTFYFVSYEHTYERRSESRTTTSPSADWLRGDFRNVRGAGADGVAGNADDTNRVVHPLTKAEFAVPNVIPESLWHPVARNMLPFIPASNTPGSLERYLTTGQSESNRDQILVKVDHRFGTANNAFIRWARQSNGGYDPFPSDRNFYPGFGRDTARRADTVAFSDTHIFSPTLINEVRVGAYDQRSENLGEHRGEDWIAKFGIPGLTPSVALQGWPAIRIDGYSEFGDRPNDPFIYDLLNVQLFNMLTWVKGTHNVKAGVDAIRSNYVESDVRNVRGDFRFRGRNTNPANAASSGFRSFADFLVGLPDATQRQIGADPADLTGWQTAFFIQDDWRVGNNLTLNLGVRYERQTAMKEAEDRLANFIPELSDVVISGDPRYPDTLVRPDNDNLGPRAGFAWRPFGGARTVLRGGGGVFFSMETFNPIRQQLAVTFPFVVREQYTRLASDPGLLSFSNPFPGGRGGVQGLNTPFGMDANYNVPEFYQYNLTVERELLPDLTLEVGYVGSQGRFLGRRFDMNQPIPIGLSSTGTLVTARRYPQFGDIQYQDQTAVSSYDALQTSLRRRAANGLTMLVSYTWSKAIDTASSTNNSTTGTQKFPQDIYNIAAERSLSDFHRAHQFSGSFNYDLPIGRGRRFLREAGGLTQALLGGWQLNGIVTLLSGRPFTPQYNAADISQQRPDLVGDPKANIPDDLWFNPAAFARPVATAASPELYGNAGRNSLIGPDFRNLDLGFAKNVRFTNRRRLQFRAEIFNATNRPNFQVPVFLLDRTDVGRVTATANEGREFQFALRLYF
jgi:hypothetical protein